MTAFAFCYDSISINELPQPADAVAGYVDGRWPTFNQLLGRYPGRLVIAITVESADPCARVADVENGDLSIADAIAWGERVASSGRKPVFYISLDRQYELELAWTRAGHARSDCRVWAAHWTDEPHICSLHCGHPMMQRPGMTQWTDRWAGRNVDASLASEAWLNAVCAPWPIQTA
jgi:hypothetical protein